MASAELALEREQLRLAGGKVAVVVQAGFADRFYLRLRLKFAQQIFRVGVEIAGMMRMHASGGEKPPRIRQRQGMRRARTCRIGTGDHHLRHAMRVRPRQHRVQVMRK